MCVWPSETHGQPSRAFFTAPNPLLCARCFYPDPQLCPRRLYLVILDHPVTPPYPLQALQRLDTKDSYAGPLSLSSPASADLFLGTLPLPCVTRFGGPRGLSFPPSLVVPRVSRVPFDFVPLPPKPCRCASYRHMTPVPPMREHRMRPSQPDLTGPHAWCSGLVGQESVGWSAEVAVGKVMNGAGVSVCNQLKCLMVVSHVHEVRDLNTRLLSANLDFDS